jgi:hypothetical protein
MRSTRDPFAVVSSNLLQLQQCLQLIAKNVEQRLQLSCC